MKLKEWFVNAVFPPRCAVCREPMDRDRLICPRCEQYVNHPAPAKCRCPVCFLPKANCVCGKKLYYDGLAVPFLGNTPAKPSVYAMKYQRKLWLIRPLAGMMKLALDERDMTGRIERITFVPMRRKDERVRGFNQAEELARELAQLTGLPCEPLLKKVQDAPPQHEAPSRLARSGNLLGVYEPIKERIPDFVGKSVLVVDDISTTGATFNETAKTLLIFGADKIYCAAALLNPKKKRNGGEKA